MFMFNKICRLCISDKDVSSTLNSDNIILLDEFNRIAPELLKLNNSSLPTGICTTCFSQLNQACKFIKNCLRSQEILNKYLEQLEIGNDTEQGGIEIITIPFEQNKMINYMEYMNIDQIEGEFPNTLVNYEKESGFIKQEYIIEYNDDYESIQGNFEDDIRQEETNVKMENSDINVKEECLSEEQLYETDIIDYKCTVVKFEDEIKIEDHDSKNAFLDIPTITKQSDFCGFNSTEYSLANDIKVKYTFELNRLCDDTNKYLIDFQNERNNKTYSKNCKNNVDHLKYVRKALKRSSTRKLRQNSSKDSSDVKVNIRSQTTRAPYICNADKKARKNQSDITRKIGTGKRSYECKICGKGFIRPSELTRHIRTHTGEKPYECKTCTKAFITNGQLTTHIRTHTGEKPYKCKTCTKAFIQNEHLVNHIRKHTGEKPFQCKVCTKAFITNGQLTTHTRTHTGEKPFQCKMCKKAYALKNSLYRHVRSHTANGTECK